MSLAIGMLRLSPDKRNQAIGMHTAGMCARDFAMQFQYFKSTITRMVLKFGAFQTVDDLPGRGWPEKTNQEQDQALIQVQANQSLLHASQMQ